MLNSLELVAIAFGAAAALGLAAYLLLRRRRPRPLAELAAPSANPTRDQRRHDAKHGSHMMMAVFVTLMVSVLSFVMTFDGLLADLARISGVTIDNKLEALHTAFVISVMITVVWTILFAVRLYATTLRAFVAIFGLGIGFLIWCLTVDGVANYSAWAGAGSELIYRSHQVDEAEKRVAGMVKRGRELPGLISAVEAEARIARSKAECERTSGCLSGSAGQGSVYVTMIALADRADTAAARLKPAQAQIAASQAEAERLIETMRRALADRKTEVWERVDIFLASSFELDAILRRLEGLQVGPEVEDFFALVTASIAEIGTAGQTAALRAEQQAMRDRAAIMKRRIAAITAIEIPSQQFRSDATFSEVLWASWRRYPMYVFIAFGVEFVPFFLFALLMLQQRPKVRVKRSRAEEKAILIGRALPKGALSGVPGISIKA
ncbi:MAG: hypothetical protein MRY74_03300 [Neomegalonema sp.]|nr:hypothetical protein [Neomegalonema sp.]